MQAGQLAARPLVASLPLAALIEGILHANNARDVLEDRANGVRTLSSALGAAGSAWFFTALLAAPYASALAHAWRASAAATLPLISARGAASLVADFHRGHLAAMPMRAAKLQMRYGLLLVLGVLLPAPPLAAALRRLLPFWPG